MICHVLYTLQMLAGRTDGRVEEQEQQPLPLDKHSCSVGKSPPAAAAFFAAPPLLRPPRLIQSALP